MEESEQIIFHKWGNNVSPFLSIVCFTYNHELFIRDTLEGFIKQKTTFRVEIIVHDDASKDFTANIIKSYEEQYPNLFNPIYQKINQRSLELGRVTRLCFNKARGKYIALCEGDDYWTDPYKLQKQIDFLESNPGYGMVHTDCDLYYQKEGKFIQNRNRTTNIPEGYIFNELLKNNFISTLTVVCETGIIRKASEVVFSKQQKFMMGDYPLWLEISKNTKIGYLSDSTAVYRIHNKSVTHGGDIFNLTLATLETRLWFAERYNSDQNNIAGLRNHILKYRLKRASFDVEKKIAEECFRKLKTNKTLSRSDLFFYLGSKSRLLNTFLRIFLKLFKGIK